MFKDTATIVIDNGLKTIRTGISGEDNPRYIFPTVVGKPKFNYSVGYKINNECILDYYVGENAISHGFLLNLGYPIEHGIVTNCDYIEMLYTNTFYTRLRADPEDHPVLLSEAAMNTKKVRAKMIQIMFENFNVPSLFFSMRAVLSFYSSRQQTGLIMQSGDEVTDIVPIKNGRPIMNSILSYNFGGKDLTIWLQKNIKDSNFISKIEHLEPSDIENLTYDMKKELCYVCQNYDVELQKAKTTKECESVFKCEKNGECVTLNDERFKCPEIMFNTHIQPFNFDFEGIHKSIHKSINKCDKELHNELYSHIFLSGGNSHFRGLSERLENEIKKMTQNEKKVEVTCTESTNAAWIGGSIFASDESFASKVVTNEMYKDSGADIFSEKFC